MSLFYPTILLKRITDLKPQMLQDRGILALILDADNTLTTHNNPIPDQDVLVWIEEMQKTGIQLVIASNNSEKRIQPFAGQLGLAYISRALKPLTPGFSSIAKKLGLQPRMIAVVGDQIFTDILGGNLFGAMTVLVEPMLPETGPFFRLKRRVEVLILKNYRKKQRTKKAGRK